MDLSIVFFGTGGSVPTARRATACVLVRRGGDRLLFDCGEGSQRQMVGSTGLVQLDEIYITHFHADHYLGLPGLLKTYDLQGRERPLRVLGPRGLTDLFKSLRRIFGGLGYELELVELDEGEAVEHDGYEVQPFAVEHRMKAHGYALVEDGRPGRFDAETARGLGVSDVRDFGRLQRGEEVEVSGGTVAPQQVLGEARQGRKLVITGDTAPSEMTRIAAHEAEVLIHDGSFGDEDVQRAVETGHSTTRQAAELASEAGVQMLALVHISSRYNIGSVLEQAQEAHPGTIAPRDFDLIEIPFPERGGPELIPNGARERPEPELETSTPAP
ncbi:MAG: ribonuclease Z [Solirubrobacterales bacterium]|nr:ribonuclease Z [Solirubrobacterales bacterium]